MKRKEFKIASSMIEQQDVYGPPSEHVYNENMNSTVMQQMPYGSSPDKPNSALANTNIIISIILFILGIVAIFNKKISKRAKTIIILSLIAIGVIITIFIKYISIK